MDNIVIHQLAIVESRNHRDNFCGTLAGIESVLELAMLIPGVIALEKAMAVWERLINPLPFSNFWRNPLKSE